MTRHGSFVDTIRNDGRRVYGIKTNKEGKESDGAADEQSRHVGVWFSAAKCPRKATVMQPS